MNTPIKKRRKKTGKTKPVNMRLSTQARADITSLSKAWGLSQAKTVGRALAGARATGSYPDGDGLIPPAES